MEQVKLTKERIESWRVLTDGIFIGANKAEFNAVIDLALEAEALRAENERLRAALMNIDRVAVQLNLAASHPFGHDSYHFQAMAQSVEKYTKAALAPKQADGGGKL